MRKISYNYIKPQNYYNHLLTFFTFVALSLTFSLVQFNIEYLEIFFLKFIIILFLILFVSVLIEFFYMSEYIGPIEIYNVEKFINRFLKKIHVKDHSKFFNKYDIKSKKKFEKIFNSKDDFFISSIRKHKQIYEITIINQRDEFLFIIARLFGRKGVHKLFLENHGKQFKIIRFN